MSYFGDKLNQLLELNNLTGADVQRVTGIHASQVSRWISGGQHHVSPEDMDLLAKLIGKTKAERAELVVAYMRDACYGPGSDLIQIVINAPEKKNKTVHLTRDDRLFNFLRQVCIEKPLLKKVLLNLASIEGFK